MRKNSLNSWSVDQLVDRFAEIGVAQYDAIAWAKHAKFNRLFKEMSAIVAELKAREGDQRIALMRLRSYNNMQVRVQAAKYLRAVAPEEARRQLEAIAQSKWYPQAGDAGMSLALQDAGISKPS